MINEKRVFIGIPICSIFKPVLSVLKSKFTQYYENIKLIPSEDIHLNLKYFWNISVNDLPFLIQSLKKDLTQNSFVMVIGYTGVFPSYHSPRALWLGIKRETEELISLHTQIEKSLGKITAKNPELTFTPPYYNCRNSTKIC